MMVERMTLGQRIADAAAGWRMAEVDHGVSSDAAMDAWAELLTLCECADAAERLAKAADALDTAHGRHCREGDTAGHAAAPDEFRAALTAWREVAP